MRSVPYLIRLPISSIDYYFNEKKVLLIIIMLISVKISLVEFSFADGGLFALLPFYICADSLQLTII